MKMIELHSFSAENWKLLETQFSSFSTSVLNFVTENKGSLPEAEEIYIKAFIYYTQLLELHGFKLSSKGEDLVYSFSRKLWIKVLSKRNVDTNFVMHRRSFFEVEDAFHEIESINERSEKTARKLAEIGEPARTLVLEHIGKQTDLATIGSRLGYSTEAKALAQIAKSLRKLIRITESKTFELDANEFENLVSYVLSGEPIDQDKYSEEQKVALTMISRSVAMIRNHVSRKNRLTKLRELQLRVQPDVNVVFKKSLPNKTTKPKKKMKPAYIYFISAAVAVFFSVITAGFIGSKNSNEVIQTEETTEAVIDTAETVEVTPTSKKIQKEAKASKMDKFNTKTNNFYGSAFPITNDGLFLTSVVAKTGDHFKLYQTHDGSTLEVEVVYTDTIQNLSLLKGDFKSPPVPYMLARDNLKIAQKLYSLGFDKESLLYNEGVVYSEDEDGVVQVSLEIATQGAPVVSEKGQILGVVLTGHQDDLRPSVITTSKIRKLISDYEANIGERVTLTSRNKLFYSEVHEQVSRIKPYIYQVKEI